MPPGSSLSRSIMSYDGNSGYNSGISANKSING